MFKFLQKLADEQEKNIVNFTISFNLHAIERFVKEKPNVKDIDAEFHDSSSNDVFDIDVIPLEGERKIYFHRNKSIFANTSDGYKSFLDEERWSFDQISWRLIKGSLQVIVSKTNERWIALLIPKEKVINTIKLMRRESLLSEEDELQMSNRQWQYPREVEVPLGSDNEEHQKITISENIERKFASYSNSLVSVKITRRNDKSIGSGYSGIEY